MSFTRINTYLASHDGSRRYVPDFTNSPAIPGAEVLDDIEVLWSQIHLVLDADLQLGHLALLFLP